MKKINRTALIFCFAAYSLTSYAEETIAKKTETVATQAADGVKTGIEDAREKVCQLTNGKLKCAYKRIKNKFKK